MSRITILFLLLATIIGCAATKPAPSVKKAGFLSDYSKLEENVNAGGQLRYINKNADWKKYDKVLLDPVQFWRSSDVEASLTPQQGQGLVNYFHSSLYEHLSKSYEMVSIPGPNTLRISVVFTRLGKRNVTLDTVSTYVPQLRLVTQLSSTVTGRPAFVGEASMEGKITDGATGEILGAAVDSRVGGRTIKDMDDWADVRSAIDFWASSLAAKLCRLRGDSNC